MIKLPCSRLLLLASLCCPATAAETTNHDWKGTGPLAGLRCIGDAEFPLPAGMAEVPVPNGDLHGPTGGAGGWDGAQIVRGQDGPQGAAYAQIEAKAGKSLRTPRIPAAPGQAYFLSFWLRSPAEHWANLSFTSDQALHTFTDEFPDIPGTGGEWKRVGLFFRVPVPAVTVQLNIVPRAEPQQPGQFIAVAGLRLRTASDAELDSAYATERSHYPASFTPQGPDDGSNLALSIAKWEGRAGIPGKPFVIWALGSSWTAAQKNGYGLIRAIRERFPHCPPILYFEHDGAGTPWDFAAGWMKQFVALEQPDLIFTYTVGTPEGLERLLTEIRRRTTADIIVPSIHFPANAKTEGISAREIATGYTRWDEVRAICRRHHAEFVEHRPAVVEYMKRSGLQPDDLLWDHVHQNELGRMLVWDDVALHLTRPDHFTYDPKPLESRWDLAVAGGAGPVELAGEWTPATEGGVISQSGGDRVKLRFTGNRVDLIGRKLAGGGSVEIRIDGQPAADAPAFGSDYIRATPKIYPKPQAGGQPGDVAPHAVELGRNLVPQNWTITMTDDTGDFELRGSVTGPDGTGNVTRPFWSTSGQIGLDPVYWRKALVSAHGETPRYGNGVGDRFDFRVFHTADSTVNWSAPSPVSCFVPLARNLRNGPHEVEIVTRGGPVCLQSLYVYAPPEK